MLNFPTRTDTFKVAEGAMTTVQLAPGIEAKNNEKKNIRRARNAVGLRLNQEKEKNSQQLEQTSLENERILAEQRFA